MRIGELARRAETNITTLRFYERSGMLRQPPRTAAGYRVYGPADLEQVRFIRHCQKLGFSLSDIQKLSALHGMAVAACPRPASAQAAFQQLCAERLAYLDERIASLRALRRQVAGLQRIAVSTPVGCPAQVQPARGGARAPRRP
jgi:MerR family mercuric resistance operon transcriptional regulator